jgi:signal transduction histidine kinase
MDQGRLSDGLVFHQNPTDLMTWSVLGVGAAFHTVVIAAVITGLLSVHRKALRSERQASIQAQEEASRREAAFQALERESRERQRLEAALLNAGEEERRLMGAEVHDGLCQQLTAALLNCAAAERRGDQERGKAAEDIQLTRTLLEQCIDEAYALAHRLSPLQMSGMELSSALSRLAEQTRRSAEITCEYREQGDVGAIGPQAGAHLYRIAQEAVRNAIRHAQASEVILELRGEQDAIHLRILDDGVGIGEPAGSEAGGMGMRTMAYRASLIGGRLLVCRRDTGGTVVECVLPNAQSRPALEVAGLAS